MWRIYDALNDGDIRTVREVALRNPEVLTARTWLAGAAWIHYAAREGMLDALKMFLEMGVDPNLPDYMDGESPLSCAARSGQMECLRLLLNNGAGLDVTRAENNPLFNAMPGGSAEVARLLLDHGIDAGIVYTGDMDAAAWAIVWGRREIAHMIAEHRSDGSTDQTRQLLEQAQQRAARYGGLRRVHVIPADDDIA